MSLYLGGHLLPVGNHGRTLCCLNRGEQQLLQGLYVHARWKWSTDLVLCCLLWIRSHAWPRDSRLSADYPDTLALRTEAQYLFDLSNWYPPIGHVAPLGGWFSVTT